MKSVVISPYRLTGAVRGDKNTFVPIGFGLEALIPQDAKNGDSWELTIEPYVCKKHLDHTFLNNSVLISNPQEILSQIQGNLVVSPNDSEHTVNLPNRKPVAQLDHRSHSIVSFFNHIFLVKGKTLWWTDLDNIWEWQPHPHNEADFRTLEWQPDNCTGLVRSGDQLFVHFPKAIYEVSYVGKPTVVAIRERVHGIGGVSPRSIIVHNSIQFFIGTDNFYAYSTETGVAAIGHDIWNRFVASRGDIESTWAYVDQLHNEICWVSGDFIWAFNFVEKHWCKYSTDGILDHATVPWYPTADTQPYRPNGLENLWLTENVVCREANASDGLDQCLNMTKPFLESDDITYGDLHFVKQVDLLVLDAKLQFPWVGFRVFVSGRDFVTQDTEWVDCGLWTQEHKSKQLDFFRIYGKVLKFRFELVDCLNWNGLLPNGTLSLNGERLDFRHGVATVGSGMEEPTLTAVWVGDKPLGFVELNAWGERVDLPQALVGPDK